MSTSKSLVLAFIWVLLLSFIFMLFVCILGEPIRITSDDVDGLTQTGVYRITNCADNPFGRNYTSILYVTKLTEGTDIFIRQVAVRAISGVEVCKIRWYWAGTGWTEWKDDAIDYPTFYKNYSTLENLAKAVNGLITLDVPQSLDADDILYTGVYQTNLLSNIPVAGGHLLICIRGNTDYVAQILIKVSGSPEVYIRSRVDRSGWSWTGWNRLSMSVV